MRQHSCRKAAKPLPRLTVAGFQIKSGMTMGFARLLAHGIQA